MFVGHNAEATVGLTFLDRRDEVRRLRALARGKDGALAVLYGRRRCGKSRLVQEALPRARTTSYVSDERDASLQRAALAAEVARRLPGFADVAYPDWASLLSRWAREAPARAVLAIDELPSLVAVSPELPSLLQKHVDGRPGNHLVLAGSSQRMMQGLVLDRSAPLFGRAREILKVEPLAPGWIRTALGLRDAVAATEAYAVWGGVPRYWELARDHEGLAEAVRSLVLSPLGVLHDEPRGLLRDEWREAMQPLSILTLVGAGCHRPSEIAGRLGRPATSLSRSLAQLVDLGLLRRDVPFASGNDGKRGLYRIGDPFLAFWFRYVAPNRSRLEARLVPAVERDIAATFAGHVGGIFEELVRRSVPRGRWLGTEWGPARAYWGPGTDQRPLEVDVVAESADRRELLVGEVKWQESLDLPREQAALERKAGLLPFVGGRLVRLALWVKRRPGVRSAVPAFGPDAVLRVLR